LLTLEVAKSTGLQGIPPHNSIKHFEKCEPPYVLWKDLTKQQPMRIKLFHAPSNVYISITKINSGTLIKK